MRPLVRGMAVLAVSVAAVSAALPLAPATAMTAQAAGTSDASVAQRQTTSARSRIAVGDSVMEGARAPLRHHGYRVDAAVSRQVDAGVAELRHQRRSGTLPRTVVVHLGTNGTFSTTQCQQMHRTVGPDRRLFLLTVSVPRSWAAGNNRVIRRCAQRFDNVWTVPWKAFSDRRPWVFAPDGYHLSSSGGRAYARLVARTVDRVLARAS